MRRFCDHPADAPRGEELALIVRGGELFKQGAQTFPVRFRHVFERVGGCGGEVVGLPLAMRGVVAVLPHDFEVVRIVALEGVEHEPDPVLIDLVRLVSLADNGFQVFTDGVHCCSSCR